MCLRPCESKKIAKGGLKWPNIGKARGPEKSTKRSVQKASKTRPARGHHGLTVGLQSTDSSAFFVELFFLLFSFLTLVFCFVIFNLNIEVWSWIYENLGLISRSCVSFVAFEFVGLFYRFLDANIHVRILITFLHVFGFWVMNWKVRFETGSLGIDLVVCSIEKVTPINCV